MDLQEDYCSIEIVKLLKEKGFKCGATYSKGFVKDGDGFVGGLVRHEDKITHQMAMKWLREVHNKHCDIGYDIDLGWFFQIIDLKETVEYDYLETKCYHTENEIGFNSYEEAVEAAIKYSLENLI